MAASITPTRPATPENWNLVADSLKLFYYIYHKSWRGLDPVVAYDAGVDALLRAVQCYDPTRGCFSTFASVAVYNALRSAYRNDQRRKTREVTFSAVGLDDLNAIESMPAKTADPADVVAARDARETGRSIYMLRQIIRRQAL